jgi:oligosaccharide repeat unit polymerase
LSNGYSRSVVESGFVSTVLELIISVIAMFFSKNFWVNRKIANLLPYIMVLFISLMAASRAVIIIQTIFLVGCGIISSGSLTQVRNLIFVSLVVLLVFFLGIGFFRGSFSDTKSLFEVFFSYLFGGLFAFESFYELNNNDWALSFFNVVPGLAKFLNMFGLTLEVNNYNYTAVTFPYVSNIYTTFRELITSFGVKGSLVFAFLHGLLNGRLDMARKSSSGIDGMLAPIVFTGNVYFLFYTITMFVFVVIYLLTLPFIRFK